MSPTHTSSLIEKSQLVLSAGPRQFEERQISKKLKMGAPIILSMAIWGGAMPAYAAQSKASDPQIQSSSQHVQQDRLEAEVVAIRQAPENRQIEQAQNQRKQTGERFRNQAGRAIGTILGGIFDQKLGGRGFGHQAGGAVGELTASGLSEMISKRKASQNQVAINGDQVIVTVDVNVGGSEQRYEIKQPASLKVKAGDRVYIQPDEQGQIRITPQNQPAVKFKR